MGFPVQLLVVYERNLPLVSLKMSKLEVPAAKFPIHFPFGMIVPTLFPLHDGCGQNVKTLVSTREKQQLSVFPTTQLSRAKLTIREGVPEQVESGALNSLYCPIALASLMLIYKLPP